MSYVPQSWVDDVTPVDAAHMTHIEDGLVALSAGGSLSAVGDVLIQSDNDASGAGDFIVRTGPVERFRVKASGAISGLLTGLLGWYSAKDAAYGAKGDAKVILNGAITTGTAALTAATAAFAATDVGKSVAVAGAGAAGAPLATTILAYVSATQVTLNANASATVSGVLVAWGTDDTAAIQAAHNTMPATGGELILPAGSYYLSSPININRVTTIRGAGAGSASHTRDSLTRLITASPTNDGLNVTAGGLTIEDVQLYNISGVETAGAGIHITSGSYMHINRCSVWGFYDGLDIDTGIYYTIEACYFLNPVRYGIRIQDIGNPDAGDGFIGSGTVLYPRSTGSTSGIRWETGGGLKIEGIKINANGAGGFAKGIDAAIPDANGTSVFIVDGNSVEGCANTAISVTQQGTTGLFGKIIITANEIGPAGTTPTGIAVISTTVGNLSDVIIADNFISATLNGIQIDGVTNLTIGNNQITGGMSDSGISIRNVTGGSVFPNTITGQWVNAAINIKSSGTPSSALAVDHQNIISGASAQTLILDSSAGVVSSLKRNRIVYDEMREMPGGIGTVTYVTAYQLDLPPNIGIGGVLEFEVFGKIIGGSPAGDAFAIYGKRLLTLPLAGGASVVAATIGADVVAGTVVDYQLNLATAGSVRLQLRINPTQAGTGLYGQVRVKYDGTLTRLVRL